MFSRIPQGNSYFDKKPEVAAVKYSIPVTLCQCSKSGSTHLTCPGNRLRELKNKLLIPVIQYTYKSNRRRKRRSANNVADNAIYDDADVDGDDIDDEISYVFHYGENDPKVNLTWPTASGISEENATEACLNAINGAKAKALCADVITEEVKATHLDSCKIDIQVSKING